MILILKYSKKREGFKIEGKKQRKNWGRKLDKVNFEVWGGLFILSLTRKIGNSFFFLLKFDHRKKSLFFPMNLTV